jgi:hypothetical protein
VGLLFEKGGVRVLFAQCCGVLSNGVWVANFMTEEGEMLAFFAQGFGVTKVPTARGVIDRCVQCCSCGALFDAEVNCSDCQLGETKPCCVHCVGVQVLDAGCSTMDAELEVGEWIEACEDHVCSVVYEYEQVQAESDELSSAEVAELQECVRAEGKQSAAVLARKTGPLPRRAKARAGDCFPSARTRSCSSATSALNNSSDSACTCSYSYTMEQTWSSHASIHSATSSSTSMVLLPASRT